MGERAAKKEKETTFQVPNGPARKKAMSPATRPSGGNGKKRRRKKRNHVKRLKGKKLRYEVCINRKKRALRVVETRRRRKKKKKPDKKEVKPTSS